MNKPGIILFGGSFDPVHRGHIAMADFAMQYLSAHKVLFIAASRSPHKNAAALAAGCQRLEMIRLAICGRPQWEVSDCELIRPQPSYSFDTVCHFRTQYGSDVTLYWLAGADVVSELPRWYRIEELLDLCRLCILYRAGFEVPLLDKLEGRLSPRHIDQLRKDVIPAPLVDVSSTKIRRRIALGQEVESFLPPAVWGFIRHHRLYGYGDSAGA